MLLLAHGSESTPGGATFVRQHADSLRQKGVFADVQAAFLRNSPHPRELIKQSAYRDIYLVPFMVSGGYSIDVMIPNALDLTGPLTELISVGEKRKRIHLCRPVGTHHAIRKWSMEIVAAIMANHGLMADDTAVVVLSHGTPRHKGGRRYAEQVLRDIGNNGHVAETAMLFLEEQPKVQEWRDCVNSLYVIALPYLMTAGRHGSLDIPTALGIDAHDAGFQTGVSTGITQGVFDIGGRKLWYAPLLGTFSAIPDIIVDRIADWDKSVEN